MRLRRVAIIPAPGSGLASMARTGQLERLFLHLSYYANRFSIRYVTWGEPALERELWAPFAYYRPDAQLVLAKHERPSVLNHCDVIRCLNLAATIPALLTWKPIVMSYGADYPTIAKIRGGRPWKWRVLRRLAFARARCILVPNERMAKALDHPRVVHHPNWVDCEHFSPAPTPKLRPKPAIILFVGRLVKEKNLVELAHAVAGIPNAKLVCVGEGPEKEHLLDLGAVCPGPKPWPSLPAWYRNADVFVMPSLSEGHPKALAEAMACGVPCVVSEAVTEGGDSVWRGDLRRGITACLYPDVGARYGEAARDYAVKHWDVGALMPRELEYMA